MASVKENPSKAREMLSYALGKKRIILRKMKTQEVNELLNSVLEDIDLREMRGFKEIPELLRITPGNSINLNYHTLKIQCLEIARDFVFETKGFTKDDNINKKTHALKTSLGIPFMTTIYKNLESQKETESYKDASSWGKNGINFKGKGLIFAIYRPRDHKYGNECLITITFSYEKVVGKNQHVIKKIIVEKQKINKLYEYFGNNFYYVVWDIINNIETCYSQTLRDLKSKTNYIEKKGQEIKRISKSISYEE